MYEFRSLKSNSIITSTARKIRKHSANHRSMVKVWVLFNCTRVSYITVRVSSINAPIKMKKIWPFVNIVSYHNFTCDHYQSFY